MEFSSSVNFLVSTPFDYYVLSGSLKVRSSSFNTTGVRLNFQAGA